MTSNFTAIFWEELLVTLLLSLFAINLTVIFDIVNKQINEYLINQCIIFMSKYFLRKADAHAILLYNCKCIMNKRVG